MLRFTSDFLLFYVFIVSDPNRAEATDDRWPTTTRRMNRW
jgi:hypothetical protein